MIQFNKDHPLFNYSYYRKSGPNTRRNIIQTIISQNVNKDIHQFDLPGVNNRLKFIPNTTSNEDDDARKYTTFACQSCQENCPSRFKFDKPVEENQTVK